MVMADLTGSKRQRSGAVRWLVVAGCLGIIAGTLRLAWVWRDELQEEWVLLPLPLLHLPLLRLPGQQDGVVADVPTGGWEYRAVSKLERAGLFTGYPPGTFSGRQVLTRYEFGVALLRLVRDVAGGKQPTGISRRKVLRSLAGLVWEFTPELDLLNPEGQRAGDILRRVIAGSTTASDKPPRWTGSVNIGELRAYPGEPLPPLPANGCGF
jgi:hypothetical protein